MGFIGSYPIQENGGLVHQPIGGISPGIYVTDSNGVERYVETGETEFSSVTETASYTIYYYEILEDGTRLPESGYSNTGPNSLSLGENLPITITGTESSATVVMYRGDAFTITTTGGTAIGTIPTIESTISGGAWSITPPGETLLPSYKTQSPIEEGDNTVTMQYTDGNGDVFTSSNTIAVRYASTAPIVEIDSQDIQTDIQTENYQVTVTYLYGGSLLFDAGEQLTDIGEALYYGGVLVDVTNYGLLPAANSVQVTGETDDFGQSFDTTIEVATKIPAITNNGLTEIDEETYGTTYTATNILTIDSGAAYETTATPTEAPYTFTSGDYKDYNFTASYTYPATSVSNSIAYNITYRQYSVPKILELESNDVTLGQVPKLNIAGGGTINVKWLNSSYVEQNDTDPVVAHEFATNVVVTRETTATATYSHKTGIPVATLLYYRDDAGTRVDFNGTYEIPGTVEDQPITFGWSVTNGNVSGEVEQTEFTQTLTIDSANDVIMPAFTDDWGNSIPEVNRTQSVVYGQSGDPDLKAEWDFTLGDGTDLTGNGWDAVTENGIPTYDANGVNFDGSSNLVVVGSVGEFYPNNSEWTDVVVFKKTSTTSGSINGIGSSDTSSRIDTYLSTTDIFQYYYLNRVSLSSYSLNTEYEVVTVCREDSPSNFVLDVYLDKTLEATVSLGGGSNTFSNYRFGAILSNTGPDVIGSSPLMRWWIGSCARSKYYTKALTQTEINNL